MIVVIVVIVMIVMIVMICDDFSSLSFARKRLEADTP